MPPADEQGVQGRISSLLVESGGVRMVVDNRQNLVELLHLELLARLGNLALLVDDPAQSGFIPVLEVYLFAIRRDLHHLFDVPLDRAPAVIDVDARAKNDDPFEAVAVLLQNHADERGGLPVLGCCSPWCLVVVLGGCSPLSTAKANTVLQLREERARSVWTFYFDKVLSGSRSQNNAKTHTSGQGTARCMRSGMPCYMTGAHVWECQLVQLGWIRQSRWISVARSTCAHWMQMFFVQFLHVHVLLSLRADMHLCKVLDLQPFLTLPLPDPEPCILSSFRLARTHKHPCHRQARNDGILRLLDLVGRRWKELDLPHRRFTFRDRKRRACII